MDQNQVMVFVDVSEANAIVSLPASQLRYDRQSDELKIQRSSQEIVQIARGQSGYQAAE